MNDNLILKNNETVNPVIELDNALDSSVRILNTVQASNDKMIENVTNSYQSATTAYSTILNDPNSSIEDKKYAAEKIEGVADKNASFAKEEIKANNENTINFIKIIFGTLVTASYVAYKAFEFFSNKDAETVNLKDSDDID